MRDRTLRIALLCCLPLAALSLLLPYGPLFDTWSWLIWGRELTSLELDTTAGPSWKPLPSLLAAPLTVFGGAAVEVWLLVARAAWLAVPLLAWRLAARLEGSGGRSAAAAGALAALGVVLIADEFTSWTRQGTGGLAEPLLAALVLAAIEAALARRAQLALALAFAACLVRPEAWPFALRYAWREAREGRVRPATVVAAAPAVLALWLAPDLLAAGDALEGADRARGGDVQAGGSIDALARALGMPLAALWLGAIVAVVTARDGRSLALGLGAGALAWIALVAAMAAIGFAGLPRFMLPAAAVVCALGGAGLVQAAGRLGSPVAAVTVVILAVGVEGAIRSAEIPGELRRAHDTHASFEQLRALAVEQPHAFDCVPLSVSDYRVQPPLAWELEMPLSAVTPTRSVYDPGGTLVLGSLSLPEVAAAARDDGTVVASAGEWEVVRTGPCATTSPGE